MANTWDYIVKRLIGSHARHFTKWPLDGADFIRQLDSELKIQSLYADALLEVEYRDKPGLLHIEFQSYNDKDMAKGFAINFQHCWLAGLHQSG